MSEPTKKPREYWLQLECKGYGDLVHRQDPVLLYRHESGYEDVIHVREVDASYDAMVVAMAEALQQISDLSSNDWAEALADEALALFREFKK